MRTFLAMLLCCLFTSNTYSGEDTGGPVDLYGRTTQSHVAEFKTKTTSLFQRSAIPVYAKTFDRLKFDHEKICGDIAFNVWGIARHLNTQHQFNERNGGGGGRYYHCKLPEGMYFTFFRLKNSLSGLTYGAGLGFESELLSLKLGEEKFVIRAGMDTNYLNYGVPRMCNEIKCRDGFNVEGALPMPFIAVGTPTLQVVLHRLVPNKQIYLFGLLVRH